MTDPGFNISLIFFALAVIFLAVSVRDYLELKVKQIRRGRPGSEFRLSLLRWELSLHLFISEQANCIRECIQ